jgi:AraC family transcriptional regulator of adaptative response/methylated-DNA-[protein]-cysteine methyltransferase
VTWKTDLPRIVTCRFESPVGPLLAGAAPEGVCLLEFADSHRPDSQIAGFYRALSGESEHGEPGGGGERGGPPEAGRRSDALSQRARASGADARDLARANEHLAQLRAELDEYFAGRRKRFTVPLVVPATAFQRKVWDALLAIPYGRTRYYEEIAQEIEAPGGQRAVGQVNGQNRIAIVIPCHRVINKDGQLGGYGGGLWRKEFLLELEGARPPSLIPRRGAATSRARARTRA